MRLRLCLFLAAISAALFALPARSARRPRYGGGLRMEIAASVSSLAAEDLSAAETGPIGARLYDLIYPARNLNSSSTGSPAGPFQVVDWDPGRQLKLMASTEYSGSRPFVDSIEIQMGRSAKERLLDVELGKADIVEIPAEEARRAAESGVRLSTSPPDELIALVFVAGRPLAKDVRVRQALAQLVDRTSIANFILQKGGEVAGGLLPQWLSGTAFLFSTVADASAAKEQWSRIPGSPKISVGYDSGDGLEQAIAERIAVNAHEAGIPAGVTALAAYSSTIARADARLIRLPMTALMPREALVGLLGRLGPLTQVNYALQPGGSPEELYNCERTVLGDYRVIPIVWLPQVYGLSDRVRDWKAPGPGEAWPLADVWLDDATRAISNSK